QIAQHLLAGPLQRFDFEAPRQITLQDLGQLHMEFFDLALPKEGAGQKPFQFQEGQLMGRQGRNCRYGRALGRRTLSAMPELKTSLFSCCVEGGALTGSRIKESPSPGTGTGSPKTTPGGWITSTRTWRRSPTVARVRLDWTRSATPGGESAARTPSATSRAGRARRKTPRLIAVS